LLLDRESLKIADDARQSSVVSLARTAIHLIGGAIAMNRLRDSPAAVKQSQERQSTKKMFDR